MKMNPAPPKNIVDGTDEIINCSLRDLTQQSETFTTVTIATALGHVPDGKMDFTQLVEKLWDRIESNWHGAGCQNRGESKWAWDLVPYISPTNNSPEKRLEKALAKVLQPPAWANQVPTASGLSDLGDSHRNIDLAHWDGKDAVTIVELKVMRPQPDGKLKADTPIRAAFEILTNALLLCLARKHRDKIDVVAKEPWLRSNLQLRLRVLAPQEFYARYRLSQFAHALHIAIQSLDIKAFDENAKLNMSFAFRRFIKEPTDEPELLAALKQEVDWY